MRKQTRPLHDQLESVLGLERIVNSKESYEEVLGRFWGVWHPLEELLRRSPLPSDRELRLELRLRADRIVDDLSALHADLESIKEAPVPWTELNCAQAAGILYVLEGSTLGGAVISKRLQNELQIGPADGGSFFVGHGSRNRESWKEFLDWTRHEISNEQEIAEAVEAAVTTFELFVGWFDPALS